MDNERRIAPPRDNVRLSNTHCSECTDIICTSYTEACGNANSGNTNDNTSCESGNASPHISALPAEVFAQIFSHLTQHELCHKVAPVCQQWRDYAYDPIHWQSLDLYADTVADMSVFAACLERAPLLKSLSVCGCDRLTPEEIFYVGCHCPQLTSLEIGFTRTAEAELCKNIADTCRCLEHINLEGCALIDTPCIAALCRIRRLTSVNLSHCNRLTGSDVVTLADSLPRLEKLNIDGVLHIADGDIVRLVELQGSHLRHLDIDGEQLTDRSIAAISQCSSLEKFSITYADNLTDNALQHLQTMRLTWLKLKKGVRLSSSSLQELFVNCRTSWSRMTHLDLTECTQLNDTGISSLVKCCHKSLTYLALCWCWNITDAGLDVIINNCGLLQSLDLLGVHQISGASLISIPVCLPRLLSLNLCQCNLVDDEVLLQLVHEMSQLAIVNYYGELLESDTEAMTWSV